MDVIFFIIGAGLVAWLNHYMATNRGRNAALWAILGFLFGILTSLILLIMGKTNEKVAADEAAHAQRVATMIK